jgi:hypothetical protein
MPRRRRGADAIAVDADAGRGLAMRTLLHSPKDTIAGLVAFAAVSAIIANALFLQAGRHPSPMFGSVVAMPVPGLPAASPLPRPRPVEATLKPADTSLSEPRLPEARLPEARLPEATVSEARVSEGRLVDEKLAVPKLAGPRGVEPKAADPLTNLVKATSAAPVAPSNVTRPPAPIPVSSRTDAIAGSGPRRVAAVQRALTEYGYGQLKPTGTIGSETQAAIQRFEREHKMPVTGQMSDRLVHNLTAMIGHSLD